jgi:hypothetical protein
MVFCSVVTRNFLPHARVLADTLAEHHRGSRLQLLVVDDLEGAIGAGEPFDVLSPAAVGLSRAEVYRRAAMYSPQGLVSSLKGIVLRAVLADARAAVALLDVDMFALDAIDDVLELAERHSLVLTPHASVPLPFHRGERELGAEQTFIRAGVFNGGFLAAADGAEPFLEWWVERCARDCVHDPDQGLVLSQSWLALVPALFNHYVLRDRGVNLMLHGFADDDVEWRNGRAWIGRSPVRLLHVGGGFDPQRRSLHGSRTRYSWWPSLDERPGLARLCNEYAARLIAADPDGVGTTSWRFAELDDGTPLDQPMRHAYRLGLIAAEASGGAEPPNPFTAPAAFMVWLTEPHAAGSAVSRYLAALRNLRADLRAAFPEVPGSDEDRFRAWAETDWPAPSALIGARS